MYAETQETVNLIGRYEDGELIFVQDDRSGQVLVGLQKWFEWVGLSRTYDEYGQPVPLAHCDDPFTCPVTENEDGEEERNHCECGEFQVRAYNFWNGRNFRTIAIDADEGETQYAEITDQAKISDYLSVLKNAQPTGRGTAGIERWRAGDSVILRSRWAGGWELFSIVEDDEELD